MEKIDLSSETKQLRVNELERRRKLTSNLHMNFKLYLGDMDQWKQSYVRNQFYAVSKTGQKLLLCYIDNTQNGSFLCNMLDEIDRLNSNYVISKNPDGSITAVNADQSIREISDKIAETYNVVINYSRINGKWCYSETI